MGELHKDVLNKLVNYLVEHGYPKESIVFEYGIGKYRVDVAIIDQITKLPIQLFEIKSRKEPGIRYMGIFQIKEYRLALRNGNIPAYLVYPKNEDPGFEIEYIEEEVRTLEKIKNKDYEDIQAKMQSIIESLNYEKQKKARSSEKKINLISEQDRTQRGLYFLCWFLSFVTIVIGFINYKKYISLSLIDIGFLGVAAGFLIMPFASKLKILGFEYEKENHSTKGKDN